MNNLKKVYHGMAGNLKGKIKSPFLVYEDKEIAKEFANNYTDLNKEPKVLQFDFESNKVIDLSTEKGREKFDKIILEEGFQTEDLISYKKEYFDEENGQIENLDTLNLKKIKDLSSKVDAIKGYSVIDSTKHIVYAILNPETLINKEVLEIDLEGDLWKVEFKK